MERLAAQENSHVYLETMEETQEEGRKPNATGNTGMAGMGGKQLPKSLLAHGKERSCPKGNLKRKTRTGRILQYPGLVRVFALMRLNRRVRNRTHGGVRGRENLLDFPSYSISLFSIFLFLL